MTVSAETACGESLAHSLMADGKKGVKEEVSSNLLDKEFLPRRNSQLGVTPDDTANIIRSRKKIV